jgi:hypothetical protein
MCTIEFSSSSERERERERGKEKKKMKKKGQKKAQNDLQLAKRQSAALSITVG